VPFIARHRGEKPVVSSALVQVRHGLLLFSIVVASFCYFYAPWIQGLLYHTTDSYTSKVIQLCLLSLPGYMMVHVYGSWLTATGRFQTFIAILGIAVALNIGINLVLIPRMGASGCAVAAIISQITCGILCWFAALKMGAHREQPAGVGVYGIAAIVFCLLFYVGKTLMLNVWLILALAATAMVLIFARQIPTIKELLTNR
jgi:Na+-driven multidrug efflux pump